MLLNTSKLILKMTKFSKLYNKKQNTDKARNKRITRHITNIAKKCQIWCFFFEKNCRKMLKKYPSYDINIDRKNVEKLTQKMEDKNVKK